MKALGGSEIAFYKAFFKILECLKFRAWRIYTWLNFSQI